MSDRHFPHHHPLRTVLIATISSISLIVGGVRGDLLATPGDANQPASVSNQNVDWMGADSARSLDLGFSVLVPSYIPGPFGGSPSISASGGYYSLYWGPSGRTFVEVEGTVGGSLPAGSPADLNNELFINANVRGYDAINDVTSIYDAVWWIEGGVLYKVEMYGASESSLGIANSLVTLVPPAPEPEPTAEPTGVPAEEPDPTVTPDSGSDETPTSEEETEDPEEPEATQEPEVTNVGNVLSAPETVVSGTSSTIDVDGAEASDLVASDGTFVESDGIGIIDIQDGSVAWRAPVVEEETVVNIQLLISQTGELVDEIAITVRPPVEGELGEDTDGTGGAVPPIIGGDGTGGSQEVTIPFVPVPAP